MAAMLDTFPVFGPVSDNHNDDENFQQPIVSQLLSICARRGNAPAVGELRVVSSDISGNFLPNSL